MELMTPYAFGKTVAMSYEEANRKVREELQQEGFGVLTEIDLKEKFRDKLGREFRDYIILGTCNPALAWEAFGMELNIGTLLPCNVCVYTNDTGGTVVMVMDPVAALGMIGNPGLTALAKIVKGKMEKVLNAL
jgi:uncharacterized protein (DUF302 family)